VLGDLEKVLIQGDLSGLTEAQRVNYYVAMCKHMGLHPLSKPFEYITFTESKKVGGSWVEVPKMVLYVTKNCAEQLCGLREISVQTSPPVERDGILTVKARASTMTGRFSDATGAISLAKLTEKNLANAIMKAETKAKRRAVLSLCGLSFFDHTEVEDMPSNQVLGIGDAAIAALEARHLTPPALEHEMSTISPNLAAKPREQVSAREEPPLVGDPRSGLTSVSVQDTGKVVVEQQTKDEPHDPQTGEIIEPPRKHSGGVLYPMPSDAVVKAIKEDRYVPWMLWIESENFWQDVKPGGAEALVKDWARAITLARKYGSPHWTRVKAVFEKANITLED
jgi:hypothetical protein